MAPAAETTTPHAATFKTYNDDFLNERGKKIFCYYWEPQDKLRALLLISHGFTDHTMLYENLAVEMAKRRFLVFGHDHAGHGRSEGERAHMNSVHHLVDDTICHIGKVTKKFPNLPLFMWGHSMGGSITFLMSLRNEVHLNGIVSVAPALQPNPETATPIRITMARVISYIIPQFPIAYADISLSTRSAEQIEKMNKDPLRHHGYFKARSTVSLLKAGEDILKRKENVNVPYLLLHGDADKVCYIEGSKILHESSPSTDKSFIVYPGAYHSLLQEPDDVSLDALNRSIEWLDARA